MILLCKMRANETVEKPIFRAWQGEYARFFSLNAVGEVAGVWVGLTHRPKGVDFADMVYQGK